MTIDSQIEQAINEAVKEYNQSESVGKKLIAWLEATMEWKEDPLKDKPSNRMRLETIFESLQIKDD